MVEIVLGPRLSISCFEQGILKFEFSHLIFVVQHANAGLIFSKHYVGNC